MVYYMAFCSVSVARNRPMEMSVTFGVLSLLELSFQKTFDFLTFHMLVLKQVMSRHDDDNYKITQFNSSPLFISRHRSK